LPLHALQRRIAEVWQADADHKFPAVSGITDGVVGCRQFALVRAPLFQWFFIHLYLLMTVSWSNVRGDL